MLTVKSKYLGELRVEAEHLKSAERIMTDAPVDNNGLGQGFSPTDLVATALANCMMTMIGIKANQKEWNVDGMSAEVIKEMGSNPRRIVRVMVKLLLPSGLNKHQRVLLERVALECPVAKSLSAELHQDISFSYE